ncbi:MAG: bifunctional anthranilate synthase component I family protein/class IV aminotransferase [Burkholderiaceae bacterium]|nr:bifunctional anthranilate synthase component I family protein/class IV aminotransferase [Burkholderiaceae bacterium]
MTLRPLTAPFALLDDAGASDAAPTSRLYTGFVREHRCTDPADLAATWAAVQADLRGRGAAAEPLHAVLLADYEWGARLIGAAHRPSRSEEPAALRVLMFRRLQRLSADAVSAWLTEQDCDHAPAGTLGLTPSVDDAAFDAAIAAIHAAIADGETYQVNYTYRLDGQAWGEPIALYRRLRERQPVPYGALIALPARADDARRWVLSRSPELFLRHEAGVVTARPMKGTARRVAGDPLGDSETARELAGDIKNRAENLMIVDLLRNDLGRIALIGSVRVPQLFEIEPYATLFQMTSTVMARLQPAADLPALLRATFPCGSITGAPKRRTMHWIERLESAPRGLYCGAIGWVDAPADPDQRCEDFCLNVAIRTLTLGEARDGLRPLRLGVGAGIVMDSVAADERAECRLKARFLTALDPGFELFETMRGEPHYGIALRDEHLARLARSAQALGFAFDAEAARALLDEAAQALAGPTRLRLALAHDGRLSLRQAALAPLPAERDGVRGGPVRLIVSPQRLPDAAPLAAFKTTLRAHYDAGVAAAEAQGAFDSLFLTRDGRLVEGGRSSVFLRLDGRWWTPPVSDGALPGVMRAQLLADPLVAAGERTLTLADLQRAEAIWVSNALRGVLRAELAPGRLADPFPADAATQAG